MKSKLSILALVAAVALAAGLFASRAQTNAPADASATNASATTPSAVSTNDASTPAPAPTVAAADTAPAAATTNSTPDAAAAAATTNSAAAPAATTNTPAEAAAPATNTAPVTVVTDAAAAGGASAPSTATADGAQSATVIPLIVMDDVPLTDAIRNLARQAGLNYMLDPRIGFGQPGPDGKPAAQPMVSLRWENVSAEQALNALLNNYSLQLVQDPKTKIARVTVKDPAAPDPLVTKIIQLKYSNPSNLVAAVKATLQDKRSQVMADIRTSQLVILGTEREVAEVDKLVDRLDTMTKQVLIEARLVELSVNPTTSKGFDWSGTVQDQHLAVGNNLQLQPVSSLESFNAPLATAAGIPKLLFDTAKGFNPSTAFLDADGVNVIFSFLNTYSDAKVLSAPRTVTLDNEPAHIAVTRASPIINVTAGTANTTGGSSILYTNLGVILDVTPRISANNYVNLKVVPEVSRIFDTVSKTIGGELYQADEYDVRKIETKVMIPSGNTLVMGGMVQDDIRDAGNKVPLLGDIPVLGYLFQTHAKSRQKENLYVFITPTIVQDSDFQPTSTTFLKIPVPKKDVMEPDWSAWDDGHPATFKKKPKNVDGDFDESYMTK